MCGVPQGSILGPLLFLLYINDLPECLDKTSSYLYADDTQILSSANDIEEFTESLSNDLKKLSEWLDRNKLQHHPTNTKLMFIGSKHSRDSLNCNTPVLMNNQPIIRVLSFKCLAVKLDENLNWDEHVEMICNKVGAGIGVVKQIKKYVPINTRQMIYRALIQPYFDYCSPLWDVCNKQLKDKLQNRAARIIASASYEIRSADVLRSLTWDNLESRRCTSKATFMFKVLTGCTGPNLKDSILRRNLIQTNYILRNSYTDLTLAQPKREFLQKRFKYSGAKLWNSLLSDAKLTQSLHSFKNFMKECNQNNAEI